jgi:ketosteroid isomerase-like protein
VALQAKNLAEVSALYLDASASMRDSLKRYFETSDELNVRFSNFDILIEGNEGVATFTRNDDFKDVHSGRDMHLEVRVASVVTKQGSEWKIRGMRKPS